LESIHATFESFIRVLFGKIPSLIRLFARVTRESLEHEFKFLVDTDVLMSEFGSGDGVGVSNNLSNRTDGFLMNIS